MKTRLKALAVASAKKWFKLLKKSEAEDSKALEEFVRKITSK